MEVRSPELILLNIEYSSAKDKFLLASTARNYIGGSYLILNILQEPIGIL